MARLFEGTSLDIPPICEGCGNPERECKCTPEIKAEMAALLERERERLAPEKQKARISLQNRKGKRVVTVIEGLTGRANDLPALLARLQSVCGTGGTVKSREDLLELQGDHLDRVRDVLRQIGYRVS